jgi:hypothetical protein
VDEAVAGQWVAVAAGLAAAPVGLAVLFAGGAAQESVAATGGDVAELLDVDVDQRAGVGVLVAAHRRSGGPVQVAEPAEVAAEHDLVDGRGGQTDPWGDLGRSQPLPQAQLDDLRTCGVGVRRGLWCGRLERSAIPAGPSWR